jgi:hypothetical protein
MSSQHTGGGNEGFLRAIAAISDTDIWAVGNTGGHPLIEHWNGSTWRIVPGPDLGAENLAVLYAIMAVSANDIWAVGRYSIGTTPTFQTLIEHWNGSVWSMIPSPNVQGYQQNILQGIAAVSASNIWAVGQGYVNRSRQQFGYCTLIEHWDGTSWKILPQSQLDGGLGGIAASSNTTLWTAGSRGYPAAYHTLIERWDGTTWRIIPSPDVEKDNILQAIASTSASNASVVGLSSEHFPLRDHPLIEHWNGSRWSVIRNASVNGELDGVAMSSPTDAWAVGFLIPSSAIAQTLIEHWNGSAWSIVKSPNIGGMSNTNRLVGVAAISSNNVWAVGDFYVNKSCENNPSCSDYVLIEHWNGRSWNSIPSA